MRRRERVSRRSTTRDSPRRCPKPPASSTTPFDCRSTRSSSRASRRQSTSPWMVLPGRATWSRTSASGLRANRPAVRRRVLTQIVAMTLPPPNEVASARLGRRPSFVTRRRRLASGSSQVPLAAHPAGLAAAAVRSARRTANGRPSLKNENVYLTAEADGQEIQLSKDGKAGPRVRHVAVGAGLFDAGRLPHRAGRQQGGLSDRVVAARRRPGRAPLAPYPLPGDKFTAYELNLFDVADRKQMKPEVDRIDLDEPASAGTRMAATSPT